MFQILGMCEIAILFLFGFFGSVFEKKAGNVFGMSFVLFGLKKKLFDLDTVVIYYLCNTWVVIYSKYYSVTVLCWMNCAHAPDSDTVVNKLWRHSQQWQQVSNVTAFWIYKLNSVVVVFKKFFICTLNASKVIFVTFNLNCELHAVSVGKPSVRMSHFWRFGFCSDFF